MKRIKKSVGSNHSRLATAVTTSAMSLTLLSTTQNPLQAQDRQPRQLAQQNRISERDAVDKYFAQGYNYCDAKVLAAYWQEGTPGDAKVRLGHKMLNFGPEDGQLHIREARSEALKKKPAQMPAWYTDGGYTYDDAEVLGDYWGGGIEDSKITMSRLLIMGHDGVIKAALKSARRR